MVWSKFCWFDCRVYGDLYFVFVGEDVDCIFVVYFDDFIFVVEGGLVG